MTNARPHTLSELLHIRARVSAEDSAYTFLESNGEVQTLSFAEIDRRARAIAAAIQQRVSPKDRVLLVYPAGLDFIAAFFGCIYAGVLAVPATYPKPRRPMPRLELIAHDCEAALALTTTQARATMDLSRLSGQLDSLVWLMTDDAIDPPVDWRPLSAVPDDLALLQYTSGSTSDPKGVMVSHGNLLHNVEMIRQGFAIAGHEEGPCVFWLPAYHDMGLIGGILEGLYVGRHSVLMSPAAFLQQPIRYLRAVSDYRGAVAGGPNFSYQLCVEKIAPAERDSLDLSTWRVAFCGSEPIRAETLDAFADAFAPCGFRRESFYPCYGLAEATLLAAGGKGPAAPTIQVADRLALSKNRVVRANGQTRAVQELVSCGGGLIDQEIVIVDPESLTPCKPDRVGEIWLRGASIAQGYWNRPEENARTFAARISGTDDAPYLRTGDLGFLRDGHLFVSGRLKELIIIRGRNHYPQDIELSARQSHPALKSGAGAAFPITLGGEERLVIVHEIGRQYRKADLEEVMRAIRRAVAEEHEVYVCATVLIRPASLSRTTSGKIQRTLCRQQYLGGELQVLAEWDNLEGLATRKGEVEKAVWLPGANAGGRNGHRARHPLSGRPAKAATALPAVPPGSRPLDDRELDRVARQIEGWLLDRLVALTGVSPNEVDRDRPFAEYGLDSLAAVELGQELQDGLGLQLTPILAWNYPTPSALSTYLAGEVGGRNADPAAPRDPGGQHNANDFEQLLTEIETLSDEEAEAALDPSGRRA